MAVPGPPRRSDDPGAGLAIGLGALSGAVVGIGLGTVAGPIVGFLGAGAVGSAVGLYEMRTWSGTATARDGRAASVAAPSGSSSEKPSPTDESPGSTVDRPVSIVRADGVRLPVPTVDDGRSLPAVVVDAVSLRPMLPNGGATIDRALEAEPGGETVRQSRTDPNAVWSQDEELIRQSRDDHLHVDLDMIYQPRITSDELVITFIDAPALPPVEETDDDTAE